VFVAAIPAGLLTALVLTEVINRRAFGWQIASANQKAPEHHDVVLKRWIAMSALPVSEFVPYSYFIWHFDRFFDLAIGAGLISSNYSPLLMVERG